MTRIWLDVPFDDKDTAKAAGARWDPAERRWHAPRPGMPGLARWEALPDLPEVLPGEDRSYGAGLFVDLIPKTSWFTNVRSAVDHTGWDRLRRMVYRRAGYRCEACGAAENRARGVRMEAHERFAYDVRGGIQLLVRLVCLCSQCHTATHMGLAGIRGVQDEAIAHLMNVTGMSPAEASAHIDEAFERWARRSAVPWQVDLSLITAAGIRLSGAALAAGVPEDDAGVPEYDDEEPARAGPGTLTIRPLYDLPDYARGPFAETDPWRNIAATPKPAPKPEPGPATRALAETCKRYAAELAEIEALRSGRQ
jgi:hypothetical protein